MAAEAIEPLGAIGVAELVHLSVIGFGIGLQALLVAIAAVLRDRKLGRVLGRVLDVVGGVAIGADRRDRNLVLQHQLAVHRGRIQLALLDMALAAYVRNGQAPLFALGAAGRVDV